MDPLTHTVMTSPGLHLLTCAPHRAGATVLDLVAAVRASDPLTPIDVLVGAILLRPHLQRAIAESSPGALNVRFSTVGEFGVNLGRRNAAASGARPLPAMAERVLVAEVAAECTGYFQPVAATPGFGHAARALLRELRQEGLTPADLRTHAATLESQAKADDLAALFDRYARRRAGTYDGVDAAAAADLAAFDGAALILIGIRRLPAVMRDLVTRIADRTPVIAISTRTHPDADGADRDLVDWLTAHGARHTHIDEPDEPGTLPTLRRRLFQHADPIPPDPDALRLVSAPHPSEEVREAARQCLRWARTGIPFHEMAVGFRHADDYRALVESTFTEAGIPVYLDGGHRLAERPLGRRVLALIDLIESDLRRGDVMAFLADGRLPEKTRERLDNPSISRWDSLSRRAGVVKGIDQWRERLGALAKRERTASADNPDQPWRTDRAEGCEALIRFIDELHERFTERAATATWTHHLQWLDALLQDYVAGADTIAGQLASLARLDDLLPPVDFTRFLAVVRAEITEMAAPDDAERPGAFGRHGVNVLDLNQMRHLRFRAVIVLGLTERRFPPSPRPDPLLLDHERARLNAATGAHLPLHASGPDPEPMSFALAVAAAREHLVLSTPRAEAPGARTTLPSVFFRLAAAAMTGRRVSAEEVPHLAAVTRLRSGSVGPHRVDDALSVPERDRALIEKDAALGHAVLAHLEPRAVRADAVRNARWRDRTLTPFDGVFAHPEANRRIAAAFDAGSAVSPTTLETYAACPMRYLLGSVLRLKPLQEPEDLLQLDPLTKGSLMHDALRRFIAELPDGRLDPTRAHDHHADLMRILHDEFRKVEVQGLAGSRLFWKADRAVIIEDLTLWLSEELRAHHDCDRAVEVAFGGRWHGEEASPLDTDDPLLIALPDGLTLRIRGRIDRLDTFADGHFRITDYKTGGDGRLPKDGDLKAGRGLQLPMYLLAGQVITGRGVTDASEAAYYLITRRGGFRRITFTGADLGAKRTELDAILSRIAGGIRTGDFHPRPSQPNCEYCDFNTLCDVGRDQQFARKADDPRSASHTAMGEGSR